MKRKKTEEEEMVKTKKEWNGGLDERVWANINPPLRRRQIPPGYRVLRCY